MARKVDASPEIAGMPVLLAPGMSDDSWMLVSPTSRIGWVEVVDNRGRHMCLQLKEPTNAR